MLEIERNLPLTELTAISPIDGRYAEKTQVLRGYFSEYALIKGRVFVEIKYLQALSATGVVRPFTQTELEALNKIWQTFSLGDARRVKDIEATTRHDVKSMEYFLKEKLGGTDSLSDVLEMVHVGLTSEDVTNLSQNIFMAQAKDEILLPSAWNLIDVMCDKVRQWQDVPMVGRTHGRKAVPTTVGKEIALFAHRLAKNVAELKNTKLTGKLTGAVGNLNALSAARPIINWIEFSRDFVTSFGLEPQLYTTQIEPHDRWAKIFQIITRMNTQVESFDQNMWGYLSHDYFVLPPKKGQIGSSTMPQKGRNPIGYENSEGNAIMANWLLEGFARVLPNSRFQRHLSDSTIARNIGVAFAHTYLSWENAGSDLKDTVLNKAKVTADLLINSWEVITEGIQTKLRFLGVDRPYERLDEIAKEGPITRERLRGFIAGLPITEEEKAGLLGLMPDNYLGEAKRLTKMMLEEIEELKK